PPSGCDPDPGESRRDPGARRHAPKIFPDELSTELVGNLNRVPRRRWRQAIAIAVALRRSWRRKGLEEVGQTSPRASPRWRSVTSITATPVSTSIRSPASLVHARSLAHVHWPRHDQQLAAVRSAAGLRSSTMRATTRVVTASVDRAKPAIRRHFKTGHFR